MNQKSIAELKNETTHTGQSRKYSPLGRKCGVSGVKGKRKKKKSIS